MDEAHVHHLVGFVEDEDLDVAQAQRALVDQVEQAAGRGDENVDALRQVANLAIDRHTAEDGRDAELGEAAIVAAALRDLRGEFAGRRKRSEEHTSELQSLMRISYAVFCLKKKKNKSNTSGTNNNELQE